MQKAKGVHGDTIAKESLAHLSLLCKHGFDNF